MKAEKLIKDCTRHCGNDIVGWDKNGLPIHQAWVTPDQALRAVEIAKEELIDKAIKFLYEHREEVQTEDNGIVGWIPDEFIEKFKEAMED